MSSHHLSTTARRRCLVVLAGGLGIAGALAGCGSAPIAPYYDGTDAGSVVLSIMASPGLDSRYFVRIEALSADGQSLGSAGEFVYVNDGSSWTRRPEFSDDGMQGIVVIGRMKPGTYRITGFDRVGGPTLRCAAAQQPGLVFSVERNAVSYLGRFRHEASKLTGNLVAGVISNEAGMDMRLARAKVGFRLPRNRTEAKPQLSILPCGPA